MVPGGPNVVLFGYKSSAFTTKIRYTLGIKQIPYTFITVPSMMPRPVLRDTFNLTYRKIPVLALGRDLYCDTSLIVEALEYNFPEAAGYQSVYPTATDGRNYRPLMRGFASYWIDRPFFRATCGLMPARVWRSAFGHDRAGLIGHPLDSDKLEKKIPESMSRLDMHLSMLEPLLASNQPDRPWIFSTATPSLADIAAYTQLEWGTEVARGRLINNLTAGGAEDFDGEGAAAVFNEGRYPGVLGWFQSMKRYLKSLPSTEDRDPPFHVALKGIRDSPVLDEMLLPTSRSSHEDLDKQCGLTKGTLVSVAPDDTGRDDPTIGSLIALSAEEIVIEPKELDKPAEVKTRVHFPRLGFVVRPVNKARL